MIHMQDISPGVSSCLGQLGFMWVDVKIMVPFWVPIIIRHLIIRVPKKGP